MKRLLLLALAAISLNAQTLNPAVPAPISFTLANTDPTGSCNNPSLFYFNFINSAMWGCQVPQNARIGTWVQQNPAVGGGVTSVNGQFGVVTLSIPTDNAQLTNGSGYATAAQVPGLSAVTSVNGLTGSVNIAVPTLVSQLTNDSAFITAATAPVLSVNGLTGAITLPSANNYQTVQVNSTPVTQRPKLNLAAGANTTITPTDNGTDTTTLTITTTGGGGGGLPDPGTNGIVKRTALNTTVAATAGTDYYAPGTLISDNDLPGSITSSITGNAATATALQAAPTGCANGFLIQVDAKGNALNCGNAVTGGPSVQSGTLLPTITSPTCSATTKNSVYIRNVPASVNTNAGGAEMWVCQNTGISSNSGYSWARQSTKQVNVMAFGCKADGATDDQPCIQNAINVAKLLNDYNVWDASNPFFGSDVYIPCGTYHLASPLQLPRTNPVSYPNGPNNGAVGLIGESPTCSILHASGGTGWNGVTGAWLTATGTGYTTAPTVTFTGGGCATEPTGAAILMSGTTNVAEVYTSATGSGCTSMPTCTITGGAGSGATCEALGHAVIEWAPITVGTYQRTFGERIENLRFRSPSIAGTMAIHFQMSNTPNSGGGTCSVGYSNVCERMMNITFENMDFEDDNNYNPASIMISGDCNTCIFHNLTNNPHQVATGYQTPLLATSYWVDSTGDEGDGLIFAQISEIACGGEKVGSAPCFVGRAIRSSFRDMQCDGIHSSQAPAVCFAWYNSTANNLSNLSVEGTNGTQYLIQNSSAFTATNIGIGSGFAASGGIPAPVGIQLVSADSNSFSSERASSTNFFTNGGLRLSVDATSNMNSFFMFQLAGTNEVSGISGTLSNYAQYCLVGTCGTNAAWSHMGTNPF